jgi:L-amino acid N-acyltransferase YncA
MSKYHEIHLGDRGRAKVISMATQIRFALPTDAAGILAIYGPYCESTCVSFEIVAPTIEQIQERIARITTEYPWLVAEVDGQIAGYVYASRHHERAAYRWSVDVAVYVSTSQHRRGVGRILYETLFSILREQGYFKAFAGITLPNPASVGLHESLGFRPAAVFRGVGYKFGRWLDVGWWQMDLQPERIEPTNPQPIRILRDSAGVATALLEAQRRLLGKT